MGQQVGYRRPARAVAPGDPHAPVHAVWEITLRCDHACDHCGSRAVRPRPDELTTEELLDVAEQLVASGTREVTLIGGEAYLREDCATLVAYLAERGVFVGMQTGGRGLTPQMCRDLADAGLKVVGVSIDGPAEVHDVLRASPGSHAAGLRALEAARAAGLVTASNTQVNRLSWHFLRDVYESLSSRGVRAWRCQLTVPMGRASERPEWLLEPWQVPEVIDTLAELQRDAIERARQAGRPPIQAFNVAIGNNLGYFGPHEELLRSVPGGPGQHFVSCYAGRSTLGIESDGTVKACPSLPTSPYAGGNLRDAPLAEIWQRPELAFTREDRSGELWGFCKSCYYAEVCQAGCSWSSHVTLGRRGNMPWCYHRATQLRRLGLRERLVRVVAAPGLPYDFGRFELVLEPWDGPTPSGGAPGTARTEGSGGTSAPDR